MPNLLTPLARMNRTRVFLGALVIALIGLFLPGVWGALLLFAVVAALAALLSQTWSVTPPALRVVPAADPCRPRRDRDPQDRRLSQDGLERRQRRAARGSARTRRPGRSGARAGLVRRTACPGTSS